MTTTLIHVSDIHFSSNAEALVDRAGLVASATKSVTPDLREAVVLLSGDLAYSGKAREYDLVARFLDQLAAGLAVATHFVIVPGNHDCDFELDNATRRSLIRSFHGPSFEIDESIVASCTVVQDAFFD